MSTPRAASSREPVVARPVSFSVGSHVLSLCLVQAGRWSVRVDGALLPQTYSKQVEAWEAGVQAADALDRPRDPTH